MLNTKPTIYVVWRREPDGLVSASANHLPFGWTAAGITNSFVELLRTESWYEAYTRIKQENRKQVQP